MTTHWVTPQLAKQVTEISTTPAYVYNIDLIIKQYSTLTKAIKWNNTVIAYACKANMNKDILQRLAKEGGGLECVSPGAATKGLEAGFTPENIIVTCNAMTKEEMKWYIAKGIRVNCDSLGQLHTAAKLGAKKVGIRLNLGFGAGEHDNLITGGSLAKFGANETPEEILNEAQKAGITINGLHQHIGSGILDADTLLAANNKLLEVAKQFPDLEYVDIGGGYGVAYHEEKELDLQEYGEKIGNAFTTFCKHYGKQVQLITEPGKILVAQFGALLTTVQDIKLIGKHRIVGTDTGMQHLIRPALYGAYHKILNLADEKREKIEQYIVGNVCESSDLFAAGITLPECKVGDIIALCNAGAYGFSMASNYNTRELPTELVIENNTLRVSTPRQQLWERV